MTWPVENGDWTAVVMNSDGGLGVAVDMTAGAEVPALATLIVILLTLAGIAFAAAVVLIAVPLRAVSRSPAQP